MFCETLKQEQFTGRKVLGELRNGIGKFRTEKCCFFVEEYAKRTCFSWRKNQNQLPFG